MVKFILKVKVYTAELNYNFMVSSQSWKMRVGFPFNTWARRTKHGPNKEFLSISDNLSRQLLVIKKDLVRPGLNG